MDRATADYGKAGEEKKRKLAANLQKQKELSATLAGLEREQIMLERELSSGEEQSQQAREVRGKVRKDIVEWKEKVVELKSRAETSLKVMKEMSGKCSSRC